MTRDECYAVLFLMLFMLSVAACWEGVVQWQ
ncbi:hypothetical protein SAMN05216409_1052 [Pseudomonas lutea]|uniref:Lipoprotein n=1 Tax=Pseudomonas lutea TaxID=243924 RepID=A0A9X8MBM0_9PSED|nr:hypothetical protein SAMN05216409_104464 [Pseudomonas lutea]SEQ31342.1 hypothetical protein SAMN05216409_1052 [Pseudomonas lutea]